MARGASDLHIKAGDVFRARIDGVLVPLTKQTLTPEQTKQIALQLIANEEVRAGIDQLTDHDCSWGAPGIGRFRVNILRQRGSFMVVMRVIPFELPTLERLGLPPAFREGAEAARGLVLVAGGSEGARSATLAAMVHHRNQGGACHIVTLEAPIEFLHRNLQGTVTQREIGVDTVGGATGMRAALRQDADIVVIGAVRDAATMDAALEGAAAGCLVIAGVPCPAAARAQEWLVGLYPAAMQEEARAGIAQVLHAVLEVPASMSVPQ